MRGLSGKVVVVTHTNLYYRDQIQKFNEKYPDIQVEHVAIRPSEFAPKVITEQQNGIHGYDLWISPTSNMVEIVVPAGGFEKLTPYLVTPDVTEPTNYRGGKLLWATEEPYILLTDRKISAVADILPLLEKVLKVSKNLLIIAEDVDGEALATLAVNKLRGTLNVVAVKAPGFGDRRKENLGDLAALTGGTLLCQHLVQSVRPVSTRPARASAGVRKKRVRLPERLRCRDQQQSKQKNFYDTYDHEYY